MLLCFSSSSSSCFLHVIRVQRNLKSTSSCKQVSLGTYLAKGCSIGTESVSKVFAYRRHGNVLLNHSTQVQKLKQEGNIVRLSNYARTMRSTLCPPIMNLFIEKKKKKKQYSCVLYNTPAQWLHTTL